MQVFHRLEEISLPGQRTAVAIGNFDGVHLGHLALLKHMIETARREGAVPTVLTFFPHPVEVLNPKKTLERLTTASEKLELLEKAGVELVFVAKFDAALASLSPEAFFASYLVERLRAISVHVGFNFMFGKGRSGNTQVLEALCACRQIQLFVEEAFEKDTVRVNSSAIRQLISQSGDVAHASRLLGRPYSISGQVAHGDHRGAGLGFPTANVTFPDDKVLPKNGVYVTRATWQKQTYRSVTNVGTRPTFTEGQKAMVPRIEAHLLDFNARLYDEFLTVEFLDRIRDEKKFDSVEALKAQIKADVASARNSIAS